MYSEHQKDIFLQTELHTYKLHSYSWLCKYPTRDKQMNTDLTQQIQTCAVLKSSHLSSGICLLWLGYLFPHFLSTPNTESTFFKNSSTEKVPFFCTLKQLVFGPQWQLQGSQHLSAILPQVQSPSCPLQPTESYCCHPTSCYRNHIPKEEHQFLIVRLFGFLLIKQSIYKVLNKYTAVSEASVPYTPILESSL